MRANEQAASSVRRGLCRQRATGFEPATFSLEGCARRAEVSPQQGVTIAPPLACTESCTADAESGRAGAADGGRPTGAGEATADLAALLVGWSKLAPELRRAALEAVERLVAERGGAPTGDRRNAAEPQR